MNERLDPLTPDLMSSRRIEVHVPFSEFLWGSEKERQFSISLLDVVRFSGHACFAVTGAFLTAQAATRALFPETHVCERGRLRVDIRGLPNEGANGPIANVQSYITGAWAETGF